MDPIGSRRLFLALWPDQGVRKLLENLQNECRAQAGGRPVNVDNLHITLKFLGSVSENRVDEILEICTGASVPRYELVLDRVGYFSRARIFWIGATRVPLVLKTGQLELENALKGLGFERERRHFQPHCTLFRKAKQLPKVEFEPILWSVSRFCLVESETCPSGVRYRVLNSFGTD